jgi:hypothetical protein
MSCIRLDKKIETRPDPKKLAKNIEILAVYNGPRVSGLKIWFERGVVMGESR